MAAGSRSDLRPSSSCGLIEGADVLPVKGAGNSLRPWCTAGIQWGTSEPGNPGKSWKCLPLYLQYLVPHSECSLQLAPRGFMLFQRHSSERLVRCSRPFQSSGSGSEATWGGNGRRVSGVARAGAWGRRAELSLPERRRRASAAERPG